MLVTTGGSEALLFALNSCLDPDDEIIVPEPFMQITMVSQFQGVKVKPIKTSINSGFSLPEIDEFENLINENTKAILICNPGNPTGYLYSEEEELQRLKEIVVKHNLFLFSDEVYREFIYDGNKHISVLSMMV